MAEEIRDPEGRETEIPLRDWALQGLGIDIAASDDSTLTSNAEFLAAAEADYNAIHGDNAWNLHVERRLTELQSDVDSFFNWFGNADARLAEFTPEQFLVDWARRDYTREQADTDRRAGTHPYVALSSETLGRMPDGRTTDHAQRVMDQLNGTIASSMEVVHDRVRAQETQSWLSNAILDLESVALMSGLPTQGEGVMPELTLARNYSDYLRDVALISDYTNNLENYDALENVAADMLERRDFSSLSISQEEFAAMSPTEQQIVSIQLEHYSAVLDAQGPARMRHELAALVGEDGNLDALNAELQTRIADIESRIAEPLPADATLRQVAEYSNDVQAYTTLQAYSALGAILQSDELLAIKDADGHNAYWLAAQNQAMGLLENAQTPEEQAFALQINTLFQEIKPEDVTLDYTRFGYQTSTVDPGFTSQYEIENDPDWLRAVAIFYGEKDKSFTTNTSIEFFEDPANAHFLESLQNGVIPEDLPPEAIHELSNWGASTARWFTMNTAVAVNVAFGFEEKYGGEDPRAAVAFQRILDSYNNFGLFTSGEVVLDTAAAIATDPINYASLATGAVTFGAGGAALRAGAEGGKAALRVTLMNMIQDRIIGTGLRGALTAGFLEGTAAGMIQNWAEQTAELSSGKTDAFSLSRMMLSGGTEGLIGAGFGGTGHYGARFVSDLLARPAPTPDVPSVAADAPAAAADAIADAAPTIPVSGVTDAAPTVTLDAPTLSPSPVSSTPDALDTIIVPAAEIRTPDVVTADLSATPVAPAAVTPDLPPVVETATPAPAAAADNVVPLSDAARRQAEQLAEQRARQDAIRASGVVDADAIIMENPVQQAAANAGGTTPRTPSPADATPASAANPAFPDNWASLDDAGKIDYLRNADSPHLISALDALRVESRTTFSQYFKKLDIGDTSTYLRHLRDSDMVEYDRVFGNLTKARKTAVTEEMARVDALHGTTPPRSPDDVTPEPATGATPQADTATPIPPDSSATPSAPPGRNRDRIVYHDKPATDLWPGQKLDIYERNMAIATVVHDSYTTVSRVLFGIGDSNYFRMENNIRRLEYGETSVQNRANIIASLLERGYVNAAIEGLRNAQIRDNLSEELIKEIGLLRYPQRRITDEQWAFINPILKEGAPKIGKTLTKWWGAEWAPMGLGLNFSTALRYPRTYMYNITANITGHKMPDNIGGETQSNWLPFNPLAKSGERWQWNIRGGDFGNLGRMTSRIGFLWMAKPILVAGSLSGAAMLAGNSVAHLSEDGTTINTIGETIGSGGSQAFSFVGSVLQSTPIGAIGLNTYNNIFGTEDTAPPPVSPFSDPLTPPGDRSDASGAAPDDGAVEHAAAAPEDAAAAPEDVAAAPPAAEPAPVVAATDSEGRRVVTEGTPTPTPVSAASATGGIESLWDMIMPSFADGMLSSSEVSSTVSDTGRTLRSAFSQGAGYLGNLWDSSPGWGKGLMAIAGGLLGMNLLKEARNFLTGGGIMKLIGIIGIGIVAGHVFDYFSGNSGQQDRNRENTSPAAGTPGRTAALQGDGAAVPGSILPPPVDHAALETGTPTPASLEDGLGTITTTFAATSHEGTPYEVAALTIPGEDGASTTHLINASDVALAGLPEMDRAGDVRFAGQTGAGLDAVPLISANFVTLALGNNGEPRAASFVPDALRSSAEPVTYETVASIGPIEYGWDQDTTGGSDSVRPTASSAAPRLDTFKV